ncbi:MAG: hypothetical protein ACFFD4_32510 [Candidatus Odinarchaeota archaeon]
MGTIKGEIPPELERRFRTALRGLQKGAISKALAEAIELWLKKHEHHQQVEEQFFYQQLLEKQDARYVIINKETREVLSKGDDIIQAISKAKKLAPGVNMQIISREHHQSRHAQLGWRTKTRLSGSQKVA